MQDAEQDSERDTGPPREKRISPVGNLSSDHSTRDQGDAAAVSRSLRRGGSAAIVLALAAISLSACAAGNTSETLQVKPDTPATTLGDNLRLNNIVVVTGATQASGEAGPANVTVNISNTGSAPEPLQAITVGDGTASFADAQGAPLKEIVIPAGGAVLIGGNGQPSAHLTSVALKVGGFAPAAFAFAQAGKVDTVAQVSPATGLYAAYAPAAPSPAASGSASASASVSASASASGSASAGASTSGTASPSASASAH